MYRRSSSCASRAKERSSERLAVKNLGMKYVNIPSRPFSASDPGANGSSLSLSLHNDFERILYLPKRKRPHGNSCRLLPASEHDGWDKRAALLEARKHGMSS